MLRPRFLAGAIIALVLSSTAGCARRAPSEAEAGELKAKAEPIIKALEDYYAKHGAYPATIGEIGQQHFETPFGFSRYETFKNRQMCQLIIGELESEKNFNLHWTGMGSDSHKFPQKWTFVVYPK